MIWCGKYNQNNKKLWGSKNFQNLYKRIIQQPLKIFIKIETDIENVLFQSICCNSDYHKVSSLVKLLRNSMQANKQNSTDKFYEIPVCSICLLSLERNIITLLCGHCFHYKCIIDCWKAKDNKQCPNCRKQHISSPINLYYNIEQYKKVKPQFQAYPQWIKHIHNILVIIQPENEIEQLKKLLDINEKQLYEQGEEKYRIMMDGLGRYLQQAKKKVKQLRQMYLEIKKKCRNKCNQLEHQFNKIQFLTNSNKQIMTQVNKSIQKYEQENIKLRQRIQQLIEQNEQYRKENENLRQNNQKSKISLKQEVPVLNAALNQIQVQKISQGQIKELTQGSKSKAYIMNQALNYKQQSSVKAKYKNLTIKVDQTDSEQQFSCKSKIKKIAIKVDKQNIGQL